MDFLFYMVLLFEKPNLVVGNNYMPVPSLDKWGGVRKEIANYLTILLKYLMDQYNQLSSDMVLEIAKVGSGGDLPAVGKFGLGERNDAGDRLIQCCTENRLSIMDTWFEQPNRRLHTWTAPNGIHRNQIDYILSDMIDKILKIKLELKVKLKWYLAKDVT
ncbi:hypothetical protein HELRODRAFT_164079 [Helobdella robusta]|uniref:Uncharacterized protein n=1 Tax=Helobdella robusta TaxID=6412 RepID=T1EUW1_HELRO|nr:hypothetical protein HELRODRAFT_164079 [Helobdella robusta]ESN94270.1 hypothetical protein HELRODRAFT_164079 [Helobdella robusta]